MRFAADWKKLMTLFLVKMLVDLRYFNFVTLLTPNTYSDPQTLSNYRGQNSPTKLWSSFSIDDQKSWANLPLTVFDLLTFSRFVTTWCTKSFLNAPITVNIFALAFGWLKLVQDIVGLCPTMCGLFLYDLDNNA